MQTVIKKPFSSPLPVSDGGTGATDAYNARASLDVKRYKVVSKTSGTYEIGSGDSSATKVTVDYRESGWTPIGIIAYKPSGTYWGRCAVLATFFEDNNACLYVRNVVSGTASLSYNITILYKSD